MKIYKHGIPGIGVTGKIGKKGKKGSGFYFGTLDSFFTFIGDDVLTNSSIDYDDIDYDITYVQNEERLNPIYNAGDILYVIDDINDDSSIPVLYMVEITDDMTTCTKEYFKTHIKQYEPFTIKYTSNKNVLNYPINIVQNESILDSSTLFNLNKIYTDSAISIIYASNKYNELKETIDLKETDKSINPSSHSYELIPQYYNDEILKDEYVNNGKEINHYTNENAEQNCQTLMSFKTIFRDDDYLYDTVTFTESSLNINAIQEKYIDISSNSNLYINNLFVKKTNIGNIESYYTLYDQDLILDDNGNCYTLNNFDFDPITQSFNFDPSSFFKSRNHTWENYHFGYIHTFWNYTEDASSIINYNYYQPNYITGTRTDSFQTDVLAPKTDAFGAYIRNWNDPSFLDLTNIPIREQLINLWDVSTINDISNLLPEYIEEEDISTYKDYHGLIQTEKERKYLTYDYVQTLDGLEFRYYENNITVTPELNHNEYFSNYIKLEKNIEKCYSIITFNINNKLIKDDNETYYPTTRTNYYILTEDNPNAIINVSTFIVKYNDAEEIKDFEQQTSYDNLKIYFKILPVYNIDKENIFIIINGKERSLEVIENSHYEDIFTKEWILSYNEDKSQMQFIIKQACALKIYAKIINSNDEVSYINWDVFVLNENMDNDFINNVLYDASYNSSIIYVQDPTNYKIDLAYNDKFNLPYRHHDLVQWIQTPNGFKYYSKHTYANYNEHLNTYDITTEWINNIENIEFNESDIEYNVNNLFDFNIQLFSYNRTNTLQIDTSTKGDQEYVRLIQVYQDSSLISQQEISDNNEILEHPDGIIKVKPDGKTTLPITLPGLKDRTSLYGQGDDKNILNDLYLNKIEPPFNDSILFTVKYAVGNERTCSHLTTYEYNMTGYNEYRTLPEVTLNTYNDMESLENLNKSINGILCNQFQYFTNIKITGFDNSNWGKVTQKIKNPKLELKLTIKSIIGEVDSETIEDTTISLSDIMKIKYSIINPNIDIFNITQKNLESDNNVFKIYKEQSSVDTSTNEDSSTDSSTTPDIEVIDEGEIKTTILTLTFTLDDLDNINDCFKLRTLIETTNPIGIYYESFMYISNLKILYDKISANNSTNEDIPEYEFDTNYLIIDEEKEKYLYKSNTIKAIICPISMIAGYKQTYPNLSSINLNKWYGYEDEITVSIKPYKLDKAIEQYNTYLYRQHNDLRLNWQGMKYKMRFLQDNVKSISIDPININKIKNIIPNRLYNDEYLANDNDDIFDTYLEIVYDSNKLNPTLLEDMEVIQYNNINYLASQYGQYGNNTALFIRQRIEHILRTDILINSMKAWNKLFETMKYESDNAYPGHEETYGNGYQYLPISADKGQFLEEGLMLLENVKTVNDNLFFDLSSNEYIESNLSKTSKVDNYTPELYFRTLLYQMKWCYPKYGTNDDGYNIITQLPLIENKIKYDEKIPNDMMPYNLTYSIYPRLMFNDEEQINMVLMLRMPSIIQEKQYEMTVKDLNLNDIEHMQNIENPLKVMN